MSDGAKFQATNPNATTLSAAPPAAFGFLTSRPAAISVNGSSLGPVPGTLGLVAGPVSINSAATLAAPGGTIHVTSAAGIGEVPVDPRNTAGLTVASFGSVDIEDGSTLDAGNPNRLGPGGSVFIHAGALTINASEIGADNYGSGAGGVIMLRGERRSLCPTALLCTRRHWAAAAAPVYLFRPLRPAASRRCQPGADRQRRPGERGPACRIDKPADTDEWWPAGEHHPGTGNGGLVAVSADSMVIDGRAPPMWRSPPAL